MIEGTFLYSATGILHRQLTNYFKPIILFVLPQVKTHTFFYASIDNIKNINQITSKEGPIHSVQLNNIYINETNTHTVDVILNLLHCINY